MSVNTKERIKKLLNFNTTPRVFKHQTMHQNVFNIIYLVSS